MGEFVHNLFRQTDRQTDRQTGVVLSICATQKEYLFCNKAYQP